MARGFCEGCPGSFSRSTEDGGERTFTLHADRTIIESSYGCGAAARKIREGSATHNRITAGIDLCKKPESGDQILPPKGIVRRLAALLRGRKQAQNCGAGRFLDGIGQEDLPSDHGKAWDVLKAVRKCDGITGKSCRMVDATTGEGLTSLRGEDHQGVLAEVARRCVDKTCAGCPLRTWAEATPVE